MEALFLGIDIGSTTFKAVLMNERGKIRQALYRRTKPVDSGRVRCSGVCAKCGACNFGQLRQTVDKFLMDAGVKGVGEITCTVVTGSQIVEDTHDFVPYDFRVSEVTAHVAGARHYFPDCRAILDVGGQDSKAMVFNEAMQMWNYKMSGICAAGTGAFLDSVAAKLNVPVEEMAERANYDSDLEFSSVCAVLSATSINKFKNRFPMSDIIGGACRAQARTIMSGVGQLFLGYRGDIIFQGGVAYNRAVAYYLKQITGNNIVIPELHGVMGALGAACLARQFTMLKGKLDTTVGQPPPERRLESINLRAKATRKDFLGHGTAPLVWRNLFFPTEILNALGARSLTLETYAALFARSPHKVKRAFDKAACKGFTGETCSFLRVLEGVELPKAAFAVSTSQPCQQGERIFRDIARSCGIERNFFSLQTPAVGDDPLSIEHLAEELEHSVRQMEKALGLRMDPARLREACEHSNEARHYSLLCNQLRNDSPPLIRGGAGDLLRHDLQPAVGAARIDADPEAALRGTASDPGGDRRHRQAGGYASAALAAPAALLRPGAAGFYRAGLPGADRVRGGQLHRLGAAGHHRSLPVACEEAADDRFHGSGAAGQVDRRECAEGAFQRLHSVQSRLRPLFDVGQFVCQASFRRTE